MSLLVVGSVALDSIETPFGSRAEILGGSATFASVAASYFAPVRLLAVVGEDFPEMHQVLLRSRGIDLAGLTRRPGRTFRWKGRYSDDLSERETLETQLNVFESFDPMLTPVHRSCPFLLLGNIDPELQSRVLDQMDSPKLVAADTMDFWIRGKREQLERTLKRVDLLFVNDSEARALSGEHNVLRAARAISKLGPQLIAIKRGEHGALLFDGERIFSVPAYPVSDVNDPTGAGDAFAGGFLGYLASAGDLTEKNLHRALAIGSVMASFAVEGFSLDRLRAATEDQIFERFQGLKAITSFEDLAPGTLKVAS